MLAVNLPGRGDSPADLAAVTLTDCADEVVKQIEEAGLERVMLVGHSMAGVTVPAVAERLGSDRIARMVFLAAFVPPNGSSIADCVTGPMGPFARRYANRFAASGKAAPVLNPWFTAVIFCNGMTSSQRRFNLGHLCGESPLIPASRVNRNSKPSEIPLTWILTSRDRVLSVKQQRASMAALGGVDDVESIDTCHNAMISRPDQVAAILGDRLDRQ